MIDLSNVSKSYINQTRISKGIDDISIKFNIGEFIVIFGHSGSGKSTLLNMLAGLDYQTDGSMYVDNFDTQYFDDEDWNKYRKETIALISQDYNLIESQSVYENIMWGMNLNNSDNYKLKKKRVTEILESVGLSKAYNKKVVHLSGGEKQRVGIARALAKNTPVLLADEPTGNLDQENSELIADILGKISNNKLVIIVTHNPLLFKKYATRTIEISEGKIKEDRQVTKTDVKRITYDHKINEHYKPYSLGKSVFKYRKHATRVFFSILLITTVSLMLSSIFLNILESNQQTFTHNEIYANYNQNRLIVSNNDMSFFSESELESFYNNQEIDIVATNDLILDMVFSSSFTGQYSDYYLYFNGNTMDFIDSQDDLIWGDLPRNDKEIILALAKNTDINFSQPTNISLEVFNSSHTDQVYKVVGIIQTTNNIGTVYFTFDEAEKIVKNYIGLKSLNILTDLETHLSFANFKILNSSDIESGTVVMTSSLASSMGISNHGENHLRVNLQNSYYSNHIITTYAEIILSNQEIFGFNIDITEKLIILSSADYNSLFSSDIYQLSLFFKDSKSIDRFQKNNVNYRMFYPYEIVNYLNSTQSNQLTWIIGLFCVFIVMILFTVTLRILNKSHQNMKREELVLVSIGYEKKWLSIVNIIQFIGITTISSFFSILMILASHILFDSSNKRFFIPLVNLNIDYISFIILFVLLLFYVFYGKKYCQLPENEVGSLIRGGHL